MTVTLSNLIYRTRSLLNEPSYPTYPGSISSQTNTFFSDTELTEWVNDGLRDIARRTETLFTYDTTLQIPPFTPSAGLVPAYPLPNDIIRVQRVEFIPTGSTTQQYKLEASTQNEMDQIWGTYQTDQSSYPQYWVTRGVQGGSGRHAFTIQLYPYPSQGGQLNLFYYSYPARLIDPVANPGEYSTRPDLIEGWDDMIVTFAYYHGLIKRNDPAWQAQKALYDEKIGELIDVSRKVSNQPGYMQPSLMNGVPYWLYGPEW